MSYVIYMSISISLLCYSLLRTEFMMNLQVMNVTSAQSFFMEWAKSVTK